MCKQLKGLERKVRLFLIPDPPSHLPGQSLYVTSDFPSRTRRCLMPYRSGRGERGDKALDHGPQAWRDAHHLSLPPVSPFRPGPAALHGEWAQGWPWAAGDVGQLRATWLSKSLLFPEPALPRGLWDTPSDGTLTLTLPLPLSRWLTALINT